MSRTVNSEWLFDEDDREFIRRQLWLVAAFCGVDVITYAILSNHFHILVRIPERKPIPEEEVFRRYSILYPRPTEHKPESLEVMTLAVELGTDDGLEWLEKQRRQMGDLSQFMKLFKQRISLAINATHDRHGTLWSERFKSVLVEDGKALETMACYIDLNAVRAGIVKDPKDYRFCGYGEALAGNRVARNGIAFATGIENWDRASEAYRQTLFGVGSNPLHEGAKISAEAFEDVIKVNGKLPLHILLRCKVKYLTDGAVFGSKAFVAEQLERQRIKYGRSRGLEPKELPPIVDWGGLTVFRRCKVGIVL